MIDYAIIALERRRDSEKYVHYRSLGAQTGVTLCNMQWDEVGGKIVELKTTNAPATCSECLGIVKGVVEAIQNTPPND